MGVTYVSAADRDSGRLALTRRQVGDRHLVMGLTSMVAVIAIGLACVGRLQTASPASNAARVQNASASVVPLNAPVSPAALEGVLRAAFESAADRRLAADSLAAFVDASREAGGDLRYVGELARARVSAQAIERTTEAGSYRERLAAARADAASRGRPAPENVPALTAADLALVKPSLTVRTRREFVQSAALWGIVYFAAFWALAAMWTRRGIQSDARLLAAVHFLTAVGFVLLVTRPDPLRDTILFARFSQSVVVAVVTLGVVSMLDFRKASFLALSYVPLGAALLLCVLLIVFGDGPGAGGVKVNLGPVQPIEAIRLLLALFLAGYFARRWELLRQLNAASVGRYALPRWLALPRVQDVLPLVVGVMAALAFFFVQKDLGPALLLACVFLAMYTVARNRAGMALMGLALLVAGFAAGYALDISTTLSARVDMWRAPWDNYVRGGDQIAQSAWALATGGFTGTGLGLGDTRYLPAGHTDLALAAVGEELGFVGLAALAAVYCLIAARGFRIALAAPNDYGSFLAIAVTLFLIVPVLVMAAGLLGVIPLTGVVTPFLSYGGSAMVANFAGIGILVAIGRHSAGLPATVPFRAPVRHLGTALGVMAAVLLVALLNVQTLSADDTVVRPHLGVQADGVRRFQYNPRVLDVLAGIPRGTIFDRSGIPIATSDRELAARLRSGTTPFALLADHTCEAPIVRCYPLGGSAAHLLGDLRTRKHWSASNTSYVERDFENRLRGFDDHATVVETTDVAGDSSHALRRDFGELTPLLRHRYQPNHQAVKAFVSRTRDVTLTIDARLQARLATILAAHAAKSSRRQAAAIAMDPDTGDVLAVASYPFPSLDVRGTGTSEAEAAWLDRARYGLYPPGSTFKLVTAAAALRQRGNAQETAFVCRLLPDGRSGARIPGWRPIRDDVLDTHAHGRIQMQQGLVHSCNAYFGQLAAQIGPEALLDTAARVGISVAPSNSIERLRASLPEAGYGQGDVVATPLRMARVVGAIASGGVLREPRLDADAGPPPAGTALLSPASASLLASYLRQAVTGGTGRSLRGHAVPIAGKTGTAEVNGARSHSWFVGFAPYGAAKKRIAFAIIVENAGYGGLAAAPVAGELVTAAQELGLIR